MRNEFSSSQSDPNFLMNIEAMRPRDLSARSKFSVYLAHVVFVSLVAGCGAGTEETKTGFGGTGISAPADTTSSSGATTGLDPFSVAGRSLDESSAVVVINGTSNRSTNDLRLGMVLDVSGEISATTQAAKANTISAQSAVRGPVSAVDAHASQVTALGVLAQVDGNTVFDGLSGLRNLKSGDRIEVYGLNQAGTSNVLATRVALQRDANASDPVELLGIVSNLSNGSFQIGNATITGATVGISNGARVRVIGKMAGVNLIAATQVISTPAPTRGTGTLITVDGAVQEVLPGVPARVRINDLDIDISGLPPNLSTAMGVGVRVVVRGNKEATNLRATEAFVVAVTDKVAYTLSGSVTDFVSRASFKVRGETINASVAAFLGGTVTDLANGRRARVIGVAGAGAIDAVEVTLLAP